MENLQPEFENKETEWRTYNQTIEDIQSTA